MTYLELCQDLVALLGIAGGSGPTSVTLQTGELGNVVRWVRASDQNIGNQWEDWRFLWVAYLEQLPAGAIAPAPPSAPAGVRVRRWETDGLKIRPVSPAGQTWQSVSFMPRPLFDEIHDPDVATQGTPQVFTILPNNTLMFDRPADQLYQVKGGFFRSPPPLVQGASVPLIPEEYQRIIVVRAAVMYGDREDAPEIINGAEAEYLDILDKLEGSQLEAFRYRRASRQEQRTGAVLEPAWR